MIWSPMANRRGALGVHGLITSTASSSADRKGDVRTQSPCHVSAMPMGAESIQSTLLYWIKH